MLIGGDEHQRSRQNVHIRKLRLRDAQLIHPAVLVGILRSRHQKRRIVRHALRAQIHEIADQIRGIEHALHLIIAQNRRKRTAGEHHLPCRFAHGALCIDRQEPGVLRHERRELLRMPGCKGARDIDPAAQVQLLIDDGKGSHAGKLLVIVPLPVGDIIVAVEVVRRLHPLGHRGILVRKPCRGKLAVKQLHDRIGVLQRREDADAVFFSLDDVIIARAAAAGDQHMRTGLYDQGLEIGAFADDAQRAARIRIFQAAQKLRLIAVADHDIVNGTAERFSARCTAYPERRHELGKRHGAAVRVNVRLYAERAGFRLCDDKAALLGLLYGLIDRPLTDIEFGGKAPYRNFCSRFCRLDARQNDIIFNRNGTPPKQTVSPSDTDYTFRGEEIQEK